MEELKTDNPKNESKEPEAGEADELPEVKTGPTNKRSRLSRDDIQEFKIAFSICTEDQEQKESLHKDYLPDLFLTLGYSLGQHTIQKILSACRADAEGFLSYDDLLEAYDQWRHEDIPEEDKEALVKLFSMVRVTPEHYSKAVSVAKPVAGGEGAEAAVKETKEDIEKREQKEREERELRESYIDDVTMKALLRQVCHDPNISLETARAVIAEVDRNGSGHIDYEDFQRLMRLEL